MAQLQEKRNACRSLVRKPGEKEALVKPRHRWEDSIKKDLRGREWEGVEWINLAPNMNKGGGGFYEKGNEPLGPKKYSEFLDWLRNCLNKDSGAWSLLAHEL